MSTDANSIQHKKSASGGEFLIGRKAIMTYRNAGEGHIIVNHTRVTRENEGQGLAGRLYRAMVNFAREEHLQVTPACSYVVRKFQRHPEDRDVLKGSDPE